MTPTRPRRRCAADRPAPSGLGIANRAAADDPATVADLQSGPDLHGAGIAGSPGRRHVMPVRVLAPSPETTSRSAWIVTVPPLPWLRCRCGRTSRLSRRCAPPAPDRRQVLRSTGIAGPRPRPATVTVPVSPAPNVVPLISPPSRTSTSPAMTLHRAALPAPRHRRSPRPPRRSLPPRRRRRTPPRGISGTGVVSEHERLALDQESAAADANAAPAVADGDDRSLVGETDSAAWSAVPRRSRAGRPPSRRPRRAYQARPRRTTPLRAAACEAVVAPIDGDVAPDEGERFAGGDPECAAVDQDRGGMRNRGSRKLRERRP